MLAAGHNDPSPVGQLFHLAIQEGGGVGTAGLMNQHSSHPRNTFQCLVMKMYKRIGNHSQL